MFYLQIDHFYHFTLVFDCVVDYSINYIYVWVIYVAIYYNTGVLYNIYTTTYPDKIMDDSTQPEGGHF